MVCMSESIIPCSAESARVNVGMFESCIYESPCKIRLIYFDIFWVAESLPYDAF